MRLLALWLVAMWAGCAGAPTPTVQLPLRGGSYQALARQLAASAKPAAERDLGWLELMFGSGARRAWTHFTRAGAEPRALLGRALAAGSEGQPAAAQAAAWLALARACRRPSTVCSALGELALLELQPFTWVPEVAAALEIFDLDGLGAPQRDAALALQIQIATRRGDVARLQRLYAQRGCPDRWELSGPLSRYVHLELGRSPRAELAGREMRVHRCRAELDSDQRWGGVYALRSDVLATQELPAWLSVESTDPWQLRLDGRVLWHQAPLDERGARRVGLAVQWPRGRHQLELRIGSSTGHSAVALALTPAHPAAELRFRFLPREKGPSVRGAGLAQVSEVGCGRALVEQLLSSPESWPAWYAPLAHYLAGALARHCGHLDRAGAELAEAHRLAPGFAAPALLTAAILIEDPALPRAVALDSARRELEAWPRLAPAQLALASLLLEQEHPAQALALLRAGPLTAERQIGLHRIYRDLGYASEEERALRAALAAEPGRCETIDSLLALAQQRRRTEGYEALVARSHQCDRASEAYGRLLRDKGELELAIAEYRRLLRLKGGAAYLGRELAQLLRARGDLAGAREVVAGLVARDPGDVDDWVALADLWAAGGDRARAVQVLEEAHARMPWQPELRRALQRLTGQAVMQAWRVDGMAVVNAYRAQRAQHDAPAVQLLDRTVSRLLPTGASLSLVHSIVQVLTKEGLERWGELRLPRRAEVLTLRVIKQDGSERWPEETGGRETISLPDLAAGDFVELEYFEPTPPPAAFVGARGPRFFFSSADAPLLRSEYTVIAPRALGLRVEARGAVPRPRHSQQGDVEEWQWVARDVPRAEREPNAVPLEESQPSVYVAAGVSWERWRDHLASQAVEALRPTWLTRALVARLAPMSLAPGERVRRLYRWVQESVEPRGPLMASAAAGVARRRGNPVTVLAALLRQAGLAAEIWLAKPLTAPRALSGGLPDRRSYRLPLVYCPLPEGAVYLFPVHRWVPFGYLPPALDGAFALRAAAGGPARVRLPSRGGGRSRADERHLRLRLAVRGDGSARAEAVEQVQGLAAQHWRRLLATIDRSQVRQAFEQRVLHDDFPGATLEQLDFRGERERERPLELRFALSYGELCRPAAGRLQCKLDFVPPRLRKHYAALAARRQALQVGFHAPATLEIELSAPRGYVLRELPPPLRIAGAYGVLERQSSRHGQSARLRLGLDIAFRRVEPADYREFTQFAEEVDQGYSTSVEWATQRTDNLSGDSNLDIQEKRGSRSHEANEQDKSSRGSSATRLGRLLQRDAAASDPYSSERRRCPFPRSCRGER